MTSARQNQEAGRASNNEGSKYQTADGTWHARVITGLTNEGKPVRKHRQAKTEKEIKIKLAELIAERDKRIPAPGRKKLLVADIISDYMDNVLVHKVNTRKHYDEKNYIHNRILPAFGSVPVKSFDVSHMDEAYKAWMTDADKPIAAATVRRIHAILSVAFSSAVKRRRIDFDVTKLVTLPQIHTAERTALTLDEIRVFLKFAESEKNWVRWAIALTMGLRQGEVLGLRWRDIDFESQQLTVRHALSRVVIQEHACGGTCGRRFAGDCTHRWSHGCDEGSCGHASAAKCRQRVGEEGLVLGPPKDRRVKPLHIPSPVFSALVAHRDSQRVLQEIAAVDWWDLDFVFSNHLGQPLDPRSDNRAWKSLLTKAGLPNQRLHDARHAAGSGMDSLSISMGVIKDALGHSSTRVTERYVHSQPAGVAEAFEVLSRAVISTPTDASELPRTETETETGFGLMTFKPRHIPTNREENWSRLGDLNPGPTHYECVALPLS